MPESTGDLLMSCARSMRGRLVETMGEHGIAPGQARMLRLVCDLGPSRPSALAEHVRIAPRSVTEVVDGLEERGLVVREPDPADRRATIVAPTDAGLALAALLDEARRTASAAFLDRLTTDDCVELDRILRLLVEG